MFVGNIPTRSPTSPISRLGYNRESVHGHTFVFRVAISPHHSQPIEGTITAVAEGVAQPDLLRACGAVPAQAQHQFTLFAKLVQFTDLLGLFPKGLPPSRRKLSPRLALHIGGFVELVEVGQKTRDSGDTENAANDTGPPFERAEPGAIKGFAGHHPRANQGDDGA